jgi:hypothetical protein
VEGQAVVEKGLRLVPGKAQPARDLSPANRSRLKNLRQVDLWPYPSRQPGGLRKPMAMETILEFFSRDRDGRPKGPIIYKGAP